MTQPKEMGQDLILKDKLRADLALEALKAQLIAKIRATSSTPRVVITVNSRG